MILKESNYYNDFVGKNIKVNFENPSNNYCVGILNTFNPTQHLEYEIIFNLSPKMCVKPPENNNSEDWEIENIIYSDQDKIFENYYWSTISYTHSITSNVINSIEIVLTFEDDIKNWDIVSEEISKKYIKIDFPFNNLVRSYFQGHLLTEI